MFRSTYSLLATTLLLVVSSIPAGRQAVLLTPAPLVADGTDPIPPPLPLAVPGKLRLAPLVADGTDPIPPPLPLAVPGQRTQQPV